MNLFARRRAREPLEEQADRMASDALRRAERPPVLPARHRALHLPQPAAPVDTAGRTIEPEVRARLERGFDYDFSQVRVHVDDGFAGLTHRLGSRAAAIGGRVAFAPNEYRPGSREGESLLAHELAHVVQVAGGAAPARLLSKKAAGGTAFYQDALDRYKTSWGHERLALKPFIDFCEAVDQERASDLPALMTDLEKTDIYHYPPQLPSDATTRQLLVRITLLAQPAVATRFRAWHFALTNTYGGIRHGRRYYDDELWFWEGTLEDLVERVDPSDAKKNIAVLDGMSVFFSQVLEERGRLDAKAIAADAKRLQGDGGLTDTRFGLESRPYVSIARYHARLAQLAKDTFAAAQAPFQIALEGAIADLTAGRGGALLGTVKGRLNATLKRMAPRVRGRRIEINETIYVTERRRNVLRQVDFFLKGKAGRARSVKLESYDEMTDTTFPRPWQELEPERIVAIRLNQIDALERIYGLKADAAGKPTAEAKENKGALAALGSAGLRLHSDDDWRTFARAKFDEHLATSKNPVESLDAVIGLLQTYLRAFTVHTPMNIEDFGDNLLKASFPRALTGQLVHDCGVYALRISYILSRIRDHPALKLRFRFIKLPVHVGLIITGDGLPAYFVHNDAFVKYSVDDLQELRAKWDEVDASGQKRRTPAPHTAANDEQFLAELAGVEFVPNVDLPYAVYEVPPVRGSASAGKDALWRTYQQLARRELFGPPAHDPKDPAYQFHLRYLEVLELIKVHNNEFVVPFWNDLAHPGWKAALPALKKAERALQSAAGDPARMKAARAGFDAAVDAYLRKPRKGTSVSIEAAFAKVQQAFSPILSKTASIIGELQSRPQIVAPRVSRTSGDRIVEMFGQFSGPAWERLAQEHFLDLGARVVVPAPWAERKDLLPIID